MQAGSETRGSRNAEDGFSPGAGAQERELMKLQVTCVTGGDPAFLLLAKSKLLQQ